MIIRQSVNPSELNLNINLEDRLEAYQWTLNFFPKMSMPFLCGALKEWVWIHKGAWVDEDLFKIFPELLNQKPSDGIIGLAWWEFKGEAGILHRKMAILNCIKEVTNKINTNLLS